MKREKIANYEVVYLGDYNFRCIPWRIVDEQEDKMLVVADKGLDFAPFDENFETSWSECSLRQWIKEADFDIEAEIVPNENGDDIFLLTVEQVEKYFPDADLRRITTDKDILSEYRDNTSDDCFDDFVPWWTATDIPSVGNVCVVDARGNTNLCMPPFDVAFIRPAMWIKK